MFGRSKLDTVVLFYISGCNWMYILYIMMYILCTFISVIGISHYIIIWWYLCILTYEQRGQFSEREEYLYSNIKFSSISYSNLKLWIFSLDTSLVDTYKVICK